VADVTVEDDVAGAVARATSATGALRGVVANAGGEAGRAGATDAGAAAGDEHRRALEGARHAHASFGMTCSAHSVTLRQPSSIGMPPTSGCIASPPNPSPAARDRSTHSSGVTIV